MQAKEYIRLMWRLRPFSGGRWLVFDTTRNLLDWLTANAVAQDSFEVQLVEMSQEEFNALLDEGP